MVEDTLDQAWEKEWFDAPNAIFLFPNLTIHAQMIYLLLCRYNANKKTAWPSYKKMAERGRMSRPTAIKAVEELLQRGLLTKTVQPHPYHGDINHYRLYHPNHPHPSASDTRKHSALTLAPSKGDCLVKEIDPPLVNDVYHPSKGALPYKQQKKKIKTTTTTPVPEIPISEHHGEPSPYAPSDKAVVASASREKNIPLLENAPEPTEAVKPASGKGTLPTPDSSALQETLEPLVGHKLAKKWLNLYGVERIHEVLCWSRTEASKNPGGYIRKALEEAWPEPTPIKAQRLQAARQARQHEQQAAEAAESERIRAQQAEDLAQKQAWWQHLSTAAKQQWWNRSVSEIAQSVGMPWLAEVFAHQRGTVEAPRYGWLSAVYHLAQGT